MTELDAVFASSPPYPRPTTLDELNATLRWYVAQNSAIKSLSPDLSVEVWDRSLAFTHGVNRAIRWYARAGIVDGFYSCNPLVLGRAVGAGLRDVASFEWAGRYDTIFRVFGWVRRRAGRYGKLVMRWQIGVMQMRIRGV